MPKLLQINTTCNHGSTGRISEQIGLLMKSRGWEVVTAHGARFINPSKLQTYQIQDKKGEYIHALKSRLFDADGLGSIKATKRLVAFIKDMQPDLIQIHNLHGYYINYRFLFQYLNETKIPIVMTLHDCWPFTGHCTHFVTASCEKWKSGCGKCPQIHSVPNSFLFDFSRRNYNLKKEYIAKNKMLHLVCVSKWIEGYLRESMYKDLPICQISNGIDLDVFKPSTKKHGRKFQILGVGNPWSKDKGLYDIYELRRLLPIEEFDIVLIGLSKKQKDNLPVGIRGMSRTNNQQDLVDLYSESDVFVNPTYADTFPTTNLEAIACGTPVITYRTGGSPESVTEKTGFVVEQGDVKGLADTINNLKHNQLASSDCRAYAVQNFDKNKCFEKYYKLYMEILNDDYNGAI